MATLKERAANSEDIAAILLDRTIRHTAAADSIGETSETAVRRYRTAAGWTPADVPAEFPEAPETPGLASYDELLDKVGNLEDSNRRLYKQASDAKQKGEAMIDAVYKAARDAAQFVGHTKAVPPVRDRRSKPEEVALWHLTDWQGGKKTISYGLDVMDARIEQFVEKAVIITDVMRSDHPVRHGVVLLTGDMVEGVSIFPGQVWELDGTLFEQMFRVADRIEWTVRQALSIYETVDVICEWGNHGRLGKKGDGLKASDNVDRMVYEIVRTRLMGESRIKNFQLSGDWYQHFTVGNYSAMAIHGDEIKGFGGNIPAYGILRKVNSWGSGVIPYFTDCYIGHYHQNMQLTLANGGSVFMSGSTESDSEYAREFVAATGKPSQRINFINPERGRVTYEAKVWLD